MSKAKTAAKQMVGLWQIGQSYLIRTVTHYYTGRLTAVDGNELLIEDAAWIADTGRFADVFKTGLPREVEPMPGSVILNRGAIIDAAVWSHPLPISQK